jgi:hypothetical protein
LRSIARKLVNPARDLVGEPVSTSPDHAPAGNTTCGISSKYRRNSTDWLKAAFTVFLHPPFSKLRFIFDEAAGLMVKPRLSPRMNRALSRCRYKGLRT